MRRTTAAVLFALLACAVPALAGDPKDDPKAPPKDPPKAGGKTPPKERDPDEIPLEGEAKVAHEKEVKEILKRLRGERNREEIRQQIERMGVTRERAERDALIEFSRGNSNHQYLSHAFTALAKFGGTTVVGYLAGKDALLADEFMVQVYAAKALEEMKDVRAVPALLTVLEGKMTKIEVQGACLQALGTCGSDSRASEALFRWVEHKHDTVRANALEALGRLRTDAAYALLADRLVSEKNTRCRGAAATGLGRCGRREAIPLLQKAAASDDSMTVKACASEALKDLAER